MVKLQVCVLAIDYICKYIDPSPTIPVLLAASCIPQWQ
jgi:hypothetical protein